jgi:hypothetical protein
MWSRVAGTWQQVKGRLGSWAALTLWGGWAAGQLSPCLPRGLLRLGHSSLRVQAWTTASCVYVARILTRLHACRAGGEDGVVRVFDLCDGSPAGQFAAAADTGVRRFCGKEC